MSAVAELKRVLTADTFRPEALDQFVPVRKRTIASFSLVIYFAEPNETCLTTCAPSPFTATSGSFSSSSMPTSPDGFGEAFLSRTQVKARRGTFRLIQTHLVVLQGQIQPLA
jgi:hypothetical protein